MKKLTEIGDCESPHEKLKLGMLSCSQLQKRYCEISVKLNIHKLDALNLIRKNKTIVYQKTLNTRFREIVSSRDIPRLGTLLQICHNKGMGIQFIIGRMGDAINSRYRVRKFSEDEWDIAYLVLRIGGPKLLHVLHATHGLLIHVKIVLSLLPLIQVLRIVLYKIKTIVRSMRRLAQLRHLWMKLQQNHVCDGVVKVI